MVGGRPTKMTDEIIAKLEEGFLTGLTDTECCLYANIDNSTLYRYCQDNQDFAIRKELLKHQPKVQAKLNIINEIKRGDKETSKWYLERKSKDEFSLKQEIDSNIGNKDNKPFELSNLSVEEIKELLKNEHK